MLFISAHVLLHYTLTIAIALVWLINGLFCKVLNFVPRHQLIVAHILGKKNAVSFTQTIGWLEVIMAVWIVSGVQLQWCAILQIFIVAVMNIIEFLLVPRLLLFGRINIVIAIFFIAVVYCNAFVPANFTSQ